MIHYLKLKQREVDLKSNGRQSEKMKEDEARINLDRAKMVTKQKILTGAKT